MGLFTRFVEAFKNPAPIEAPAEPETPKKRLVEAAGAQLDFEDDGWRRLSGDADRDISPLAQSRMRDTAVWLWDSNLLVNRCVELMNAFILAEGVKLMAADGEEESQKALDKFWRDPINNMDLKLPDRVRELSLYGEQCWPVFVNEVTGHVRLGYIDPGLIATVVMDPDNADQAIGVVTVKDKKGVARRYRVIINGDEDVFTQRTQAIRESFADGECFLFQINRLSQTRRGRSDVRTIADWADAYEEFMFGELEGYDSRRAFIWHVTMTGAQADEVTAKAKTLKKPKSGSALVTNEAETWEAKSPTLNAADVAEGARLFRNHVLAGWTIPEHWFGGGGDVNRSTGDSMGEPTFKVFTMRQTYLKHMLEMIGTFVLRKHFAARSTPTLDQEDDKLYCEAQFPELTARDTTKYAAALQQVVAATVMAVQNGKMTDDTAIKLIASVAERLGVEIDAADELEKAHEEAQKQAEADAFTTPSDTADDADPAAPGQQAASRAANQIAQAA